MYLRSTASLVSFRAYSVSVLINRINGKMYLTQLSATCDEYFSLFHQQSLESIGVHAFIGS